MSAPNSTAQETGVNKANDEVNKDTSGKAVETKKTPTGGQDDNAPTQDTSDSNSETYTAERPMTMKFRKGSLFINIAQANASESKK